MNKPDSFLDEKNLAPVRAQAGASTDYRALVCVYLFGGNDSHNMIVPMAGTANRATYDAQRPGLAVPPAEVLPLNQRWGVNSRMPNVKALYDAGKLGVLMNVGYLREPVTRASYLARTARLPEQLYSHNSQTELWQGLPAISGLVLNGWMGRAGELVGDIYNPNPFNDLGPCFSVSGVRTQMQGYEQRSSDVSAGGPAQISTGAAYGAANFAASLSKIRTLGGSANVMRDTYVRRIRNAIANQAALASQVQALPTVADNRFSSLSSNGLAQQLRMVARLIQSRSALGHRRDMFFVSLGGWDDHENLVANYGSRLALVDAALAAFYSAVGDIGVGQNVITFTESEFGRALKENVGGSDHGWGGHALIMGGSVKGGQIFGKEPDLTIGGPDDAGQGRLIPSTSVEQYAGSLLKWWGVPEAQLPLVLENCKTFSPMTLDMASEPADAIPAPQYSVSFADKRIPASSGVSLKVDAFTPRTMFDADGNMIAAPVNLIENSEFVGAQPTTSMNPPANYGIRFGDYAWSGVRQQIVNAGTLPNGRRFIDVRIYGKNTGATAYPHLYPANDLSLPLYVNPGQRMVFSADVAIIGGSTAGMPAGFPYVNIFWLNYVSAVSQNYVGEGHSGRVEGSELRRAVATTAVPLTGVNAVRPSICLAVNAGAEVDITLRISAPQLENSILPFSRYGQPTEYKPTYGERLQLPRFDHDPKTGKYLGVLTEQASANMLRNAGFVDYAVGTPGTLGPGAQLSAPAGLLTSIVGFGADKGMPYLDLRIFGKATTAAVDLDFRVDGTAAAVDPGKSEAWTASVYASVVNGSLANITGILWNLWGKAAGAVKQTRAVSLIGLTSAPVRQQWFQTSMAFTDATVNSAEAMLRVSVTQGQWVDVTLRIACPQLERAPYATSWIPTWGTAGASRGREYLLADTISGWYKDGAGAMAVRGVMGTPEASAQSQFPTIAALSNANGQNAVVIASQAGVTGAQTGRGTSSLIQAGANLAAVGVGTAGNPALLLAPGELGTRITTWDVGYLQVSQKGVLGASAAPASVPSQLNRLVLGATAAADPTRVWLREFRYWNQRLTDSQLSLVSAS